MRWEKWILWLALHYIALLHPSAMHSTASSCHEHEIIHMFVPTTTVLCINHNIIHFIVVCSIIQHTASVVEHKTIYGNILFAVFMFYVVLWGFGIYLCYCNFIPIWRVLTFPEFGLTGLQTINQTLNEVNFEGQQNDKTSTLTKAQLSTTGMAPSPTEST